MITQKAETIKKCPKCGSENLTMEKMLNGKTTCIDCGYRGIHHEFQKQIEKVDVITHDEITITKNEKEYVAKHKDYDVVGVGSNEFEAVLELSKALGALMFSKDSKNAKVTELLGLYQTYHYEPSEINQLIKTLEKELGETK